MNDVLNVTAYLGTSEQPFTPAVAVPVIGVGGGAWFVDFSYAVASFNASTLATSPFTLEVVVNPQVDGGQGVQETPVRWCPRGSFGTGASTQCGLCNIGQYNNVRLVGVGVCKDCDLETTTSSLVCTI